MIHGDSTTSIETIIRPMFLAAEITRLLKKNSKYAKTTKGKSISVLRTRTVTPRAAPHAKYSNHLSFSMALYKSRTKSTTQNVKSVSTPPRLSATNTPGWKRNSKGAPTMTILLVDTLLATFMSNVAVAKAKIMFTSFTATKLFPKTVKMPANNSGYPGSRMSVGAVSG